MFDGLKNIIPHTVIPNATSGFKLVIQKGCGKTGEVLADGYRDALGLEHLVWKEVAGSVPLHCGEKEAWKQSAYISAYSFWTYSYKDDRSKFFLVVPGDVKWNYLWIVVKKFRMSFRGEKSSRRLVEQWGMLPVVSPTLLMPPCHGDWTQPEQRG